MGWLNFFKDKKKVEEPLKKITISEAKKLLKEKEKEWAESIEEIKGKINNEIIKFVPDLKEQINILDSIDIEGKREHERIKFMTSKGLNEYIEQLNKLVKNLEKINLEIEFSNYVREIDFSIDFFIRNSRKELQKATILIGKEIAETEEMIKEFHKEISIIVRQNTEIVSRIQNIEKLQNIEDSFYEARKERGEIDKLILSIKEEKRDIVNKKNKKRDDLNLFQKSEELKIWFSKKEKLKNEKEKLSKDASKLKEDINFKLLLNKFHSIPKDLNLLKEYSDSFLDALMSDKNLKILSLIGEKDKELIGRKLKDISERHQHLKSKEEIYKTNKKEKFFKEDLGNMDHKIIEIDKKIEKESKRLDKSIEKEGLLKANLIKIIEGVLDNVKIVDEKKEIHSK